jgi:hypothetical protein
MGQRDKLKRFRPHLEQDATVFGGQRRGIGGNGLQLGVNSGFGSVYDGVRHGLVMRVRLHKILL